MESQKKLDALSLYLYEAKPDEVCAKVLVFGGVKCRWRDGSDALK